MPIYICTDYIKEAITCDGILHVTCFIINKSPILYVQSLPNLSTMNILDPIVYHTLFLQFSHVGFRLFKLP